MWHRATRVTSSDVTVTSIDVTVTAFDVIWVVLGRFRTFWEENVRADNRAQFVKKPPEKKERERERESLVRRRRAARVTAIVGRVSAIAVRVTAIVGRVSAIAVARAENRAQFVKGRRKERQNSSSWAGHTFPGGP